MDKKYSNRIIGEGEEAPEDLLANPANWRIHPQYQQKALEGVLLQVGWVQRVIVNQRTGHLVDGHLRVMLAMRNNETSIPVLYVDLSTEEEALVLATLDPIAAMAATDREKLSEVMSAIQNDNEAVQGIINDIAQREQQYYTPNTSPGISAMNVNADEFLSAQEKLNNQISGASKSLVALYCPHCNKEYYVGKDELKAELV